MCFVSVNLSGGVMKPRKLFLFFFTILLIPYFINAQGKKKKEIYEFEIIKDVKATTIKNQGKTNTSWSFATMSFIESELIRIGKGERNLSPMFNVRYVYPMKAENFIRHQGSLLFDPGGQAHDVIAVIKKYGFVPEEIYSGKNFGEENHNHAEMDALLKAIVETVIKNKSGKITPRWHEVFESILNIYLGIPPIEFTYQGKTYTPKNFAELMGVNPADYVEVTSYSHHPFYTKFNLEIPANITNDLYFNVTIDDLTKIIDNAIEHGYSVVWDGDITEKSFDKKKGIATIPSADEGETTETEQLIKEKVITQELRQQTFDDQTSTDDHNMHITGIAKDRNGNKFYYAKNSYGSVNQKYGGYIFMSESYFRMKTNSIMLHKEAIPLEIKTKLGL
jgi:bleomycin hydrolase